MRVLITDTIAEEAIKICDGAGFEVDYRPGLDGDDLLAAVAEADALIIRSGSNVTAEVLEAAGKLAVIGRAGVGVDNIDVETATMRGIAVMNTPGGNTVSTAEHTMSLLLSLARNVAQADRSVKAGEWNRKAFTGTELQDKTLGIIGLGRVGREVATRARAFGMRLVGHDPYVSAESVVQLEIEVVELDDLFRRSDFVTLHVPKSAQTTHLVGRRELGLCREGVRIVNCARGGLIDEEALLEGLESGRVAGAAIDVYEQEPPEMTDWIAHPRVITTPHLGASTREAQENVAVAVAEQVVDALTSGAIRNAVNMAAIDSAILGKIGPYRDLARRLGAMHAQLIEAAPSRISIDYHGDMLRYDTNPITVSLLAGILSQFMSGPINDVNAEPLARERGIVVSVSRAAGVEDFTNLMAVTCETAKGSRTIAGTVFGRALPRVVRIDDYILDAVPDGTILIYVNDDTPGVLGRVGSLLGGHGVNIALVSLGRVALEGRAMTVLNVDNEIPEKVIGQVAADEAVIWARTLQV